MKKMGMGAVTGEGVSTCHRLEEPRPELDTDLNPGESESRGRVPGGSKHDQLPGHTPAKGSDSESPAAADAGGGPPLTGLRCGSRRNRRPRVGWCRS